MKIGILTQATSCKLWLFNAKLRFATNIKKNGT